MQNSFAGEKILVYDQAQKIVQEHGVLKGTAALNKEAVFDFLLYGSVVPPHYLYQGTKQLFPGQQFRPDGGSENPIFTELAEVKTKKARMNSFVDELDNALQKYFDIALAGNDGRVALMLSGGIDSGIIASYLPKDAVCVTWAGWGESSTDLRYARKTYEAFGFREHLVCQVDHIKDMRLCEQAVEQLRFPFAFSAGAPYLRMAEELKSYFKGEKYTMFMGQNADTISGSFLPTVFTYHFIRAARFTSWLPIWEGLSAQKRKLFLLSTTNPVKLIAFFHSNGLYPGPWLRVPENYFQQLLSEVAAQIGRKPKNFTDLILMDELMTEARRNQFMQQYLPGLHGAHTEVPYYDEQLVKIFLSMPQSLRRHDHYGKTVLRELARKRGVPEEVIEKGKKGLSYGYNDIIANKLHLPVWEDMQKDETLNHYVDVAAVRSVKQDDFHAWDRLRSLYRFLQTTKINR